MEEYSSSDCIAVLLYKSCAVATGLTRADVTKTKFTERYDLWCAYIGNDMCICA